MKEIKILVAVVVVSITRLLMGLATTKYVNLAGNVFRREITNSSDLDSVDDLINSRHSDFRSDFGYVATWYKVGHTSEYRRGFESPPKYWKGSISPKSICAAGKLRARCINFGLNFYALNLNTHFF